MKINILSILLLFSFSTIIAQNRLSEPIKRNSPNLNKETIEIVTRTGDTTDLVAQFSADVISGTVPLTVSFTDESTGDIQTWEWDFGDNNNSSEQNPIHQYTEEGIYSVGLTIYDGTGSYTLVKENFITVINPAENCDTLHYPLQGTYSYFYVSGEETGYVSGNNSYGDLAKVDYFSDYPPKTKIIGVLFEFAIAKHGSGSNPNISFGIWDNSGQDGSPGNLVATTTLPLESIVADVANEDFTYIEFEEFVSSNNPIYVGVVLPTTVGDTLALWSNDDGEVGPGIAWEQWSNGDWYPFSSIETWALSISQAIYPIICESSQSISESFLNAQVNIYPNPAKRDIFVDLGGFPGKNISISLYNIMGALMKTQDVFPEDYPTIFLDLSDYRKGLYFMIIESGKHKVTKKVSVI